LEIEKIRRRFDSSEKTVLTGAAANPGAYRDVSPGQFSIIHFSAHGEANRQSPLDSAIILSAKDGRFKLYAHDIMRTPLQADLVTISACRSAGSRAYAGEGMVGLAWAFLRAGARNAIAGLWDVDDTSTPGMMDIVYGSMEAGKSPVEALRLAKLAMVHSADPYRKPYYWGPFQIYGR
jgi:CHAT domain-containing protein